MIEAGTTGDQFVTDRLHIAPTRLSDAAALYVFLGDPVAMQFTHHDRSLKACRARIAAYARRRSKDGVAPWTVRRRSDGMVIGWGGLVVDPFDPDWGVELALYLHPEVWGQGIATEFAQASLDWGRQKGITTVTSFARPENTGSQRVLRRLGFQHLRFVPHMQRDVFVWRA